MYDAGAIDALTAKVDELARLCAQLNQENAELRRQVAELSVEAAQADGVTVEYAQSCTADIGGPAGRAGAQRFSRRAVGVALVGAAAGLVGTRALSERSTQAAAPGGQTATTAELTTAERPAAAATTYRLFGNRRGPATAVPTGSKGLVTSLTFELTTGAGRLEGYWLWVCDQGQPTAPQTFTLWLPYQGANYVNTGEIVPATTVTSRELVPGRWNYVPLPHAVPLSIATSYQLATGAIGGVPLTQNRWGTGDPWARGVTSGPLVAPSAGPNSTDQGAVAPGANPTKVVPAYSSESPYFWLDVQVTTEAPAGSSYRLWPSMPLIAAPPKTTDSDDADTSEQSCGTEFWLSTKCTLNKIWFFSPIPNPLVGAPAATLLPGACAIFDIATQGIVNGTLRGTAGPRPAKVPDWRKPNGSAAKAGDGWIYCAYEGVKLPAGKYKTAVYCYGGGMETDYKYYFFQEQRFYFGPIINDATGVAIGPAMVPNGITNGPLYSPSMAKAAVAQSNGTVPVIAPGATVHGNSTYQLNNGSNTGTFLYPYTFDSADEGEVRWVDVEVTP
ncbi:MAG TPA: hypothetical protein VN969_30070 [Streptosporangiaceae bacterium]|nr:hypothetical protein [Streptosporangiaceae bacterium]